MNNEPFAALGKLDVPAPDAGAKARALAAGTAAFEVAREEQAKKMQRAAKGKSWRERLKSIVPTFQGNWIMDMRLPVATAAMALLLLPLGYQLLTTTSMTPTTIPQQAAAPTAPEPVETREEALADADTAEMPVSAPAMTANRAKTAVTAQSGAAAPAQDIEAIPSPAPMAPSLMATGVIAPSPAEASGDAFTRFNEQPVKAVAEAPVSTFSVDVDTASYSYVRRMLEEGQVPQPDAVRIEEMINYFPYGYPEADSAEAPFAPTVALYPTPWNPATRLLHIGIKGYEPPATEDKPSNLVFLIDTSGSMDSPDKLPLLKRAFRLLVEQLTDNDTISIVTYAGSAGVALEPTSAREKAKILSALDSLWSGGSTAGAEGIELAYRLAEEAKVEGGINRVILATDGDFNVGISDPDELEDYIKAKRDSGVFLSVLGFGTGNLGDDTMQSLAQNGNGQASYISNFREAQKVLVEEIGGTLETIAKDVKIQVEFNPALISEYRLVGYETRALNREDFNNDKVDAGDIGAGHTVTAIYEVTPTGSEGALIDPLRYGSAETTTSGASNEYAFLRMRYKLPDGDVSQLIETPVTAEVTYETMDEVPADMRFAAAVAAFGQKLRGSDYAGDMSWQAIRSLAQSGRGADDAGYRAEFVGLVDLAASLKPDR
ncbi:vWA domain-containing protein [Devosia nitrariae]|nr:VWA domain-containing protein [Devosia nitrariae]